MSQNALNLPGSLDRGVLTTWLRGNTDLDPGNVISVSPANIIGLMAVKRIESAPTRQYSVQIRSEVISVETIREAGNSSWAADVSVDCQTRKGKVNRILDFPQRNLKGAAREAGGSAEWVTPPAGTHLYTVVSAICDAGFKRPLATTQMAAAPQPTRPPASAQQPARPPASAQQPAQQPARPPASAPMATAPRAPQPRPVTPPPVQQASPSQPRPQAQPQPQPQAPAPTQPVRMARSPAAVQIGAVSTDAQAAQALRSVLGRFDSAQVLSASTARVESNGKVLFRALIHGFPSVADARAFCATYKSTGKDCIVRDALPPGARSVVSR